MTSENYRRTLNLEYKNQELTQEDFDNTLMHFAKLYHEEQSKRPDTPFYCMDESYHQISRCKFRCHKCDEIEKSLTTNRQ